MTGPLYAVVLIATLFAFAANSLLNRAALVDGAIGPASFAAIRVAAGVLTLALLVRARGAFPKLERHNYVGGAGLSLYMLGFSYAYLSLDAGFGALLLFATVQITMFAGALVFREHVPLQRWIGAAIALAGLVVLLRPDPSASPGSVLGIALMVLAALGWGVFTLSGRESRAPLADTMLAFALSLPVMFAAWLLLPDAAPATSKGIWLAVISGALTSGCGYAMWYAVLPRLGPSRAGVAQLSVPVIATLGGVLLLGEALSWSMTLAGGLVIAGVALSLRASKSAR